MYNVKKGLRTITMDIPLKKKIQMVEWGLALAFIGCFSLGIFLVSRAANTNLREAANSSLSGAGRQIEHQLNVLEEISYMILADNTVQDSLTKARLRDQDYIQYRRGFEEMHNIVQYYKNQFDGNYLDYLCIVNDYYVTESTSSPYISQLPEDVLENLEQYARQANGAPVFVTDYIDEYGLLLTREILEIQELSLSSLGYMVLSIDLEGLVEDTTVWTSQYSNPDFYIFDGDRLVYSSEPEEAPVRHQFGKNGFLIQTYNNSTRFMVEKELELTGWNCEISIPYDTINHSIKAASFLSFFALAVITCGVMLVSNKIFDTITARVSAINQKMELFGRDHHNLPPKPGEENYGQDEIGSLDKQFAHMSHQICELIDKNYVSELLRKDAELEALEKQINPHFLYNTLESVNWRAKAIGETQISAMTEALGHLLRITLSKSTDIHTLKTELELVNSFITIQNIRFEGQLEYRQEIACGAENALIPKLTIQPLVENAVAYGRESGEDVCQIRLSIALEGKQLCIQVKNTGSQFPEDFYQQLMEKQHSSRGFGIGLRNIDQRLRINFGEPYRIAFYNEGDWAVVEIRLPYYPLKGEL